MSDLTQEFVSVFVEFVEAVIHQILHLRSIYKPELFERRRLYGITTRKSRHPDLNEYINSIASSLKVRRKQWLRKSDGAELDLYQCALQGALLQGLLHKVAVNVLGQDGMLVERYVLQTTVCDGSKGYP